MASSGSEAGIKIVLYTGRPHRGSSHFEKLGLSEEEYIIMNNVILMKLKSGPCFNLKVYLAHKNGRTLAGFKKTSQRWP